MRALPRSSFTHRTKCARITCEPARKLPRRNDRTNLPSAASQEKPTFYDVARARFARPCKLHLAHLAKSLDISRLGTLVRASAEPGGPVTDFAVRTFFLDHRRVMQGSAPGRRRLSAARRDG